MPLKEKDMIPMSDPKVSQIGHPAPAWMVNYADLMTELVCFFIVLYALSAAFNKDMQKAKKDVEEKMKEEHVAATTKMTKDGLQITIQETGENVFFKSGSSDMSPKMLEILEKIGPSLKKLADEEHEIIVEGHTDDVPIHTSKFESNWELSTARATSVVHHMIHQLDFPAKEMGAIGYGENRPLVPNDTDEHRSMNRRVVFFVKNKPPKFDNGQKKAPDDATPAPEQTAITISDANAPPVEETSAPRNTEPTTESSLPLPAEAPSETPVETTTN